MPMDKPVDAIIFDMDGTLWDAVDTYCAIWNETIMTLGVPRPAVDRSELLVLMGKPLEVIYDVIIGSAWDDRKAFASELKRQQEILLPKLGGILYPHVHSTLSYLHERVPLFMVSNCQQVGLDNFLDFTGIRPYFTECLSHGATGVDKDVNLRYLAERYNLEHPVYVGDIQKDADSTHAAGMEFVWAAYGFGTVSDAEYKIEDFAQLKALVDNPREISLNYGKI